MPGYGYASAGKSARERLRKMIEDYVLEREQLTSLFVLIDSRHEPQQIDLEFMEWLGENGVPFAIVFTKSDKLSPTRLRENMQVYRDKMLEVWEELPPCFITSSEEKTGKDELVNYIESINESL